MNSDRVVDIHLGLSFSPGRKHPSRMKARMAAEEQAPTTPPKTSSAWVLADLALAPPVADRAREEEGVAAPIVADRAQEEEGAPVGGRVGGETAVVAAPIVEGAPVRAGEMLALT